MHAVLLILYISLILAVIFLERKTPVEALLWVLVLVCLPYVGVVLYLVFGSTIAIKLTTYVRKRRLQKLQPASAPPTADLTGMPLSDEDQQVVHFNAAYNDSELTSYTDAQLFITGESHYRQLFADIRAAKHCIHVEFYTIHHDQVGEALVNALADQARAGIQVRVLCDFIANLSTPQAMFRPLLDAGGQVIRVKPYLTHYRSHRKIVVIDNQIAYIGGMNVGKQYANLAPVKTPWRDTQVRLTGPCTQVLDSLFLTDWLCSVRRRDWDREVAYAADFPRHGSAVDGNLCQFIVGGVDTRKESVKMCYLSMIRSARKRIRIQTPYFIPDASILDALKTAAAAGVQIELMVPGIKASFFLDPVRKRIRIQTPYFIPDASILDALKTAAAAGVQIELMVPGIKASFFLDPVTTAYCGELLAYGARVYKYHGYIHAKTMVVDEELCCIGSVNMDMRSLQVDDEICGVFYANALVGRYLDIFDRDLDSCTPYTLEEFETRSRKERIMESIFLLFAPLM